jgi:hypothetical protein
LLNAIISFFARRILLLGALAELAFVQKNGGKYIPRFWCPSALTV